MDRYAPLGKQKMMVCLNASIAPSLAPGSLPHFRGIQEADRADLLDELGGHFRSVERLAQGAIPDERRTEVLNKAVTFFYGQLSKLVASLRPDGLLEWLVAHHETVTREVALHRLAIPTRRACFGSEPNVVEELIREMSDLNKAAMAGRFAIEYVTARPPSGYRPISLSVHDRVQALASYIIDFGYESDLVYFGLADLQLEILPSGRLGTDREKYERAQDSYLAAFTRGHIVRSTEAFERYWREIPVSPEKAGPVDRVDEATAIEFGHSLSELLDFFREAMEIGYGVDPAVAQLPVNDLVQRLMSSLSWPNERVVRALDCLSLRPRSDYLQPPPPHRKEDVWPWRFNRELSYLRRPFLIRGHDGLAEVLWGPRHASEAAFYLASLVLEGRLKAQSSAMRQLLGSIHREQGKDFNNLVADWYEQHPGLVVRRRVKEVGTLRGSSGPPGDIDVLVADPRLSCVRVIECKDLSIARTPYEMAGEIAELFVGTEHELSVVEQHQKRADWVSKNLPQVLQWLGVTSPKKWKVEPLIVVDGELFTPFLQRSPIPVISFEELRRASGAEDR
jgi:hypothetical protein